MGNGPAAAALDPAPAPIAHTSQMMGNDYLWRIDKGRLALRYSHACLEENLDEQAGVRGRNRLRAGVGYLAR